ncbi:MAG TPA: glycyl radical protein [Spirochaetia bacterium]|nr:glycyl radical protein [Spirochaetales bacterium]HRY81473.1 glycyl radical protein [Spirochaetia bacterium]
MSERIRELREESFTARPSVSAERARILTDVYRNNEGKVSVPVLRALAFKGLCERKTVYLDPRELIVGERGPRPKACPTYPELTCHSVEDLQVLRTRPMTSYDVDDSVIETYRTEIIPYWRGRSIRDRAFADIPSEWKALYEAGLFTEFMEQRAAGHTALDGKLYRTGLAEFRERILARKTALDPSDPESGPKAEELTAMAIVCEGAIRFAERHAEKAEELAESERDPSRRADLLAVAETCRRVPALPPRTFREALQAYWFVHLGTITELNGWDAMSPGHLDQHLAPFYEKDLAEGRLTRESAKELVSCFWIKVNNTPAPPKVGVTAAESGTYNDFTNINLAGLTPDGRDGSSEVSLILLEVLDELRLLQPQANVQVSARTPDRVLKEACRVIRNGSGYPSLFNADEVVLAQAAMGKRLTDAREGGTSGCVETGCFGKEAYVLHGYLNVPKILELALNDGTDPVTGRKIGPSTGRPESFRNFEDLYTAFRAQLEYVVDWKVKVSEDLDRMYGQNVPAPFLSVYIDDCIQTGKDYYCGGARYNTDYIQCVGLGTVTDSLSAIRTHVFEGRSLGFPELLAALRDDWKGHEALRLLIRNKTPLFGNDDDRADALAVRVLDTLIETIEGRKSWRGGRYYVDMLSTTCHIYFGLKTGATPDGRPARAPESDGTSPAHGSDRFGPTAVMKSLGKLDQARTGGTLLNQRFLPATLAGEEGIDKLASLVRGYFRMGGHHVQFNVVDEATLRDAQKRPEAHRGLLVRVAGYSDYFVDLDRNHQEEIIARTAQEGF